MRAWLREGWKEWGADIGDAASAVLAAVFLFVGVLMALLVCVTAAKLLWWWVPHVWETLP